MDASPVAVIASAPVFGSEVQVSPQDANPAPKRRRLSVKGPHPSVLPPPAVPPPVLLPTQPPPSSLWSDVDEVSFEDCAHRRQYRLIYNRFMSWWFRSSPVWVDVETCGCTEELWNLGRKDYQSLSQRQKNLLLRHFLLRTGAPPWVFRFAVQQWPCDASEKKQPLVLHSQTCLLTYQGDWGVLELDPNLPPTFSAVQLTEHVRQMPEAQTLWKAFLEFADALAAQLHAPLWACCLEICLKTFEEQKQLRLHIHLYLKSDVQQLRCESFKKLRFRSSDPHLKDTLWGKKVSKANWAGAYYCLAPKRGSVFSHGTIRRFLDFPVDPSWVFNMIEGEKIDYRDAKSELVKCGKGLVRRLADLDCWHKQKQEMLVDEMVKKAAAESRAQLTTFPRWPVVDAWLSEVTKPLQPRKKCLVLHGPSRTGKTEFVRGLFPLNAVLELNCANLKDICLDGFDCLRHRAILWDEASASLVCNNRKVFQHPLCTVDLGHSPTGAHVRRYFLGHSCSVITTNRWYEDVKRLPVGDQKWLEANMVVFDVEQPLWVNPCQVDICEQAFSAMQI